MSYRKINIGAGEGTGDGDSIRLAFEKSNSNFEGADNRLQVLETGVVRADGTVTGNIVPDTDVTYDLGSSSKKFRDLYLSGNTITLGNQTISSSASGISTSGNITSAGTIQATTITSTQPSNLSGTLTGDLVGSVYSDGSATMIDGVAGVILGDVANASVTTTTLNAGVATVTANLTIGDPLNPNATLDLAGITADTIQGPISAADFNITSGAAIKINTTDSLYLSGEGYMSIKSGPLPGFGPTDYSDLDIYGGPISLNGQSLVINSDDIIFNKVGGTVDFGQTSVDFSNATVTGLGSDQFRFNITGDDSTVRSVTNGSTIGIVGGTGVTTASDANGNITITAQTELADDTTPQLGGNLDITGHNITGVGDINIQAVSANIGNGYYYGRGYFTTGGDSFFRFGDGTALTEEFHDIVFNHNYTSGLSHAISSYPDGSGGFMFTNHVFGQATTFKNKDGGGTITTPLTLNGDGSVTLGGDLDLNSNNITNVGTFSATSFNGNLNGDVIGDVIGSVFSDDSSVAMVNAQDYAFLGDTLTLNKLSVAPTPVEGMIALSDGSSWDPVGTGLPALVIATGGGSWVKIVDVS